MEDGWEPRSSLVRAAAALTVLTLLPAAALSLSGIARASPGLTIEVPADAGSGPLHGTNGLDAPTVDALMRAWESGLFASFGWDGVTATGSFLQFSFTPSSGAISAVLAKNGTETLAILESIEIHPTVGFAPPIAAGPLFTATGDAMTILAHDAPAGLLEFHTGSAPAAVIFHLLSFATAITDRTSAMEWPQASVTFSIGESRVRLVSGAGSLNVTGMTVTANMTADDLLVMRIVPAFLRDRSQASAVLDALGSGRLAAEYALVSSSDGGWIQDAVRYRRGLLAGPTTVSAGHAALWLGSPLERDGLLLLGFDPLTMPADPGHRLVVTVNGTEVRESTDVLGAFYASPGGMENPFYARLAANATVLALYLPSLHDSTVEISSAPIPRPTVEWSTEAAIIAALAVVSVAAAVMFRRRET